MRSFLFLALISVAVLCGLGFLLFREEQPPPSAAKPLIVYCAAALKPAMEKVAAEYDGPIMFRFGNSEQVLAQATLSGEGDLLLPADDSYIRSAQRQGIATEPFPVATMQPVVLVQFGNPRGIAKLDDLLKKGLRLGQANPDAAAIGKVTREHLQKTGRWEPIRANTLVFHTTVTDAANTVKLGSNDAAIVWDAVAANYPGQAVVILPELDGATGNVEIALLKSCGDVEAAKRFVNFVKSPDHGQKAFRAAGFTHLAP